MTVPAIRTDPVPQLDIIQGFVQGDATWTKLRARCLSDLYWFNDVILGYGPQIPMRPTVHALMCKFVEKKTGVPALDEAKFRKITVPREVGKTTCITQGYTVQRICENPNISVLICNENIENAKDYLAAIKWQFQSNELLRALFPEIIPEDLNETTWSATRICVKRTTGRKEPTVFVVGVGGTVTGAHPDLVIVDDMISREAMENARTGSYALIHQVNRWIHQLEPLVNKGAKPFPEIIFIGTIWYYNDCYQHIDEAYGLGEEPRTFLLRLALPDGNVQQLPMERVGDLARMTRSAIEHGRSIFPEKWTLEDLAKQRLRDPVLFACCMMNMPSDDVTATFKADWLRYFHWLDEHQFTYLNETAKKETVRLQDIDLLILVDPGGFGQGLDSSRARAAAVFVGDDLRGHKFFLDCHSEEDTYLAVANKIVSWAMRYHPRKIYIERAGQQAAFAQLVRELLKKAGSDVVVDDDTIKPESKAKEVRILEMEPYWQRGQVYVGTGPNFHEFRTQYSQFPRTQRLDVLDILGYWPRLMKKMPHTVQTPAARQAQEREAYRARMSQWRRR